MPSESDKLTSTPSNASSQDRRNQRQQVARNLQYKDSDRQKQIPQTVQQSGFTIDSFRLLSVLGRGHFGKVILSQYKKTGN